MEPIAALRRVCVAGLVTAALVAPVLEGTSDARAATQRVPSPRVVTAAPPAASEAVDRASLLSADAATAEPAPTEPERTGRVLVHRAPGVTVAQVERRSGLDVIPAAPGLERLGWSVVEGAADVDAAVASLEASALVGDAVPELVRRASALPDDPFAPVSTYLDEVRFPEAWTSARGDGAVVAVLDTGVRATHEDLAGVVLPGIDLVDDDRDADDPDGHGTLVAGVVAAAGDNGLGGVGAAYGADVLPVRVIGPDGATDADVADGVVWAADRGADVINLSLGGPGESPLLEAALRYAVGRGSVVVAAAGNGGAEEASYPAAYAGRVPGVLSVSATDDLGRMTAFSSWDDSVSVAAPGWDLIGPSIDAPDEYVLGTGTSFAAPLVSGVAALVAVRNPTWGADAVADRVQVTARDAGPRGADPYYGTGVVDAAAALGLGPAVPHDSAPSDARPLDDVPARATAVTPGQPSLPATLSPEGDVDWYAVTTTGAATVSLSAETYSDEDPHGLDVVLEVWTDDGLLVHQDANGAGRGEGTQVSFDRATTFRLRVSSANGSVAVPGYRLGVGSPLPYSPYARTSVSYAGTPQSLLLEDVTGDGVPDHSTVNPSPFVEWPGYVRVRTSDPAFPSGVVPARTVLGTGALAAVDVDDDGVHELVTGADGLLRAFAVRPSGLVEQQVLDPADQLWPTAVVAGDVDGDGDDDLVVSGLRGQARTPLTVLLRDVGDRFAVTPLSAVQHRTLALGDLDGDGALDVVGSGGEVWVHDASGALVAAPARGPAAEDLDLAAGDLDADGRDEVVAAAADDELVVWRLGPDGWRSATWRQYPTFPALAQNVAVADLDADGAVEVALRTRGSQVVTVQEEGGAPVWEASALIGQAVNPPQPQTLEVADLAGDGVPEIVVIHSVGATLLTLPPRPAAQSRLHVTDVTTTARTSGSPVRPEWEVRLSAAVAAAGAAEAVRLLDAAGRDVPVTVAVAGDRVTVRLLADLPSGSHHQLLVAGVRGIDGSVQAEPYRSWSTVAASGDRFTPVPPVRVLDTRVDAEPLTEGGVLDLDLADVLPPEATAAVLNVTAVRPTGAGWLQVFPQPNHFTDPWPTVSNLNVVPGVDQPNLVTVKLRNGRVFMRTGGMATHVVVDLAGYYSPGGAAAYVPLAPQRLIDLRSAAGPTRGAKLGPRQTVDLLVRGRAGVPQDALAVVLNVTGTGPTASTWVSAYPTPADGSPPPTVSNLNLRPGRDQPNLVTVQIGAKGSVRLSNAVGSTWLIADVAGYYSATGDHGFVPLDPVRIADSRSGTGVSERLRPAAPATLQVTGRGGVPAGAGAAVLNLTGIGPDSATNVRAYPSVSGTAVPTVSALNLVPGRNEANLAVVTLGPTGAIRLYSEQSGTHVAADVAGYFRR
ncbi:hypothetical protein GCM10028777_15440 [Angustibacter speluncae]